MGRIKDLKVKLFDLQLKADKIKIKTQQILKPLNEEYQKLVKELQTEYEKGRKNEARTKQ